MGDLFSIYGVRIFAERVSPKVFLSPFDLYAKPFGAFLNHIFPLLGGVEEHVAWFAPCGAFRAWIFFIADPFRRSAVGVALRDVFLNIWIMFVFFLSS